MDEVWPAYDGPGFAGNQDEVGSRMRMLKIRSLLVLRVFRSFLSFGFFLCFILGGKIVSSVGNETCDSST